VFVVDLFFKNNQGMLNKCVIFETGRKGETSIEGKESIENTIKDYAKMFGFQNKCIAGKTHVIHLERYRIYEIDEEEF